MTCRAVPINEHPRRIAHQPSTATFGVITLSAAKDRAFVRVFSQATWEEVASLQLDTNEIANAITSIPHPDDSTAEVRYCLTPRQAFSLTRAWLEMLRRCMV